MPPSGSRACASKPAEISTNCGAYCRAIGSMHPAESLEYSASPKPAGNGRLTVNPFPSPRPPRRSDRCRDSRDIGASRRRARRSRVRRCAACRCRGAGPSRRSGRARALARRRYAAPTATLLNRQKPMARWRSAWCPGGRTKAKPLSQLAGNDLVQQGQQAAGRQARHLVGCGQVGVSASNAYRGSSRSRRPPRRRRLVHQRQLVGGRQARRHRSHPGGRWRIMSTSNPDPLRPFRVPGPVSCSSSAGRSPRRCAACGTLSTRPSTNKRELRPF